MSARSFPDIHAAGKVQVTATADRQLRQSRAPGVASILSIQRAGVPSRTTPSVTPA
ncbi:hypothetical protein HMPREF0591_2543 [Mycobacterium parascrofulaceum ATCC BAA-614]|uniref:Uncharacterized protein n=1 Tax=Mycobacterium parascrofulaceum ATCC BAA-614 TaxID=525368 RepID=D5P8P9_9MYCO|nr:hypothetical protein HMPREF0591_2543 [Mycobacterium parascrofulaceum ATCC BAA-614]